MADFPKLIPAFTTLIVLDQPVSIGESSTGGPITLAPFAAGKGGLKSEPGYPVSVDAVFVHGSDYLRLDSSGKHARLNVDSLLKDKSGALIKYSYTGVINMSAGSGAALSGHKDAKTTPFGDVFSKVTFETGSDELRLLEQKVYVGSGRFVVEEGKPLVVEYKISEVVHG